MKRRDFIKTSALVTAAVVAVPFSSDAKDEKPKVKAFRDLGKTGLKVSDICLGAGGRMPSASMVLRAIDRGINYMDTAPDYGSSEDYIGEAMKKIQRDKIIIASKFCRPGKWSHLRYGATKKDYMDAVEGSLKRMNTDYLDVCLVHGIGGSGNDMAEEKKSLLDEEMFKAADELKKAGKIRFLGVSSHGPKNMEDLLMTAVESGQYDLIMPALNFMNVTPKLEDLLKAAHQKGVAIIAMKTLADLKNKELGTNEAAVKTAALKWVLNHPEVSGLVITMGSISDLDTYLMASGQTFVPEDRKLLDKYARRFGNEYCRTGCSQCESACPNGVAVASVLRYQMYFKSYGLEKRALEHYDMLNAKANVCMTCETTSCEHACPYGLQLGRLLRDAHHTLTFRA